MGKIWFHFPNAFAVEMAGCWDRWDIICIENHRTIDLSIHQIWKFGPISIQGWEVVVLIKALFGVI